MQEATDHVLDGVARAKANPLRDGAILALLLAKNLLELEGLVRRLLSGTGLRSLGAK